MASAAESAEAPVEDGANRPSRPGGRVDTIRLTDAGEGQGLLAAMMGEIARSFAADGLLVGWHEGGGDVRTLHATGACSPRSEIERQMLAMATEAAATRPWSPVQWRAGDPALLTMVVETGGALVTVTIRLRHAAGVAGQRARRTAARLMPTVQAFVRLWAIRMREAAQIEGMVAALDRCGIAVMLVNRSAQLLFSNLEAQRVIARNDGIRRGGESLNCTRLADTLRLHAAIEHVADEADARRGERFACPVVMLARDRRRPLMAAVAPGVAGAAGDRETAAVVYLIDPDRDLEPLLKPACRHYGLSPVEARLTCLLATGTALGEAAKLMRVQEQTARSYLKQIFLKTDTNRQAELVSLLLSSAVQIAPEWRPQLI